LVCKKKVDAEVESEKPAPVKIERSGYEAVSKPKKKATTLTSDLIRVNIRTKSFETISPKADVSNYAFSPDGSLLAYTLYTGTKPNSYQSLYQLHLLDTATGEDRVVARELELRYGMEWSWNAKGDALAFLSSARAGGRLQVVRTDGTMFVASEKEPNLDWADGEFTPKWSANSEEIFVSDGKRLWAFSSRPPLRQRIVAEEPGWRFVGLPAPYQNPHQWHHAENTWLLAQADDGHRSLWSFDPGTGSRSLEWTYPSYISSAPFNLSTVESAKSVILYAQGRTNPGELYIFDSKTSEARPVTKLNPGLTDVPLGDARLVRWTSFDGQELTGTLLLPPNYKGGALPTVVWAYGGADGTQSLSRYGLSSSPVFNFQVLATRGYAVFEPSIPLRENHTLEDMARSVLPGVDKLVEMGVSDPDRLAVMGQSYGSYTVLCLLTQTERFQAAVITASVIYPDLFADYIRSPKYYEQGQGRVSGTIWDNYESYRKNSPLFDFDKITTPILMGQGEHDQEYVARSIYNALERLNKKVEFRVYSEEGHVINNPDNVIDFWERRLEFLGENLGISR
jgi:dipeptidyl aminopeptidase/acylaminoacyl peptidase